MYILLYITTTPTGEFLPLRLGTSVGYQGIPLDPKGTMDVIYLKLGYGFQGAHLAYILANIISFHLTNYFDHRWPVAIAIAI